MRRRRRSVPKTDPKRAIGYLRVSTDEQELSPEAQREALRRWCEASGVEVVATYEDDVSGATELEDRPGLLAALDELEAQGAGVLLVARRDRLARDVLVAAMVERLVERVGARVESAAGEGSGDDPTSKLMRRIVDAFAEYERALIRARTKAALAVKKARGERVGSIPYGFRLADDGKSLEALPAEKTVLARAVEGRARGLTLRALGAWLEAQGLRPRSGGRWHPQTLSRIVEDAP